jgi:hypothetical protein
MVSLDLAAAIDFVLAGVAIVYLVTPRWLRHRRRLQVALGDAHASPRGVASTASELRRGVGTGPAYDRHPPS